MGERLRALGRASITPLVLVGACGCASGDQTGESSPTAEATVESIPKASLASIDDTASGWVGLDSSAAVYISFVTSPDGAITGLIQLAAVAEGGTTVTSRSDSVSGTMSGSQIAINVFGQSWTGEISDVSLQLTFPNKDGTLSQMHLSRGSIDDYNRQVSLLSGTAQEAAEVSIANSVAEAQSAQVAHLVSNLQRATANLDSLMADLPTQQQDVETSVRDVQTSADETRSLFASCDEVPSSLSTVTFAVGSVSFASSTVDYTIESIKSQQTRIRSVIAQLQGVTDNPDAPSAISVATTTITQADADVASAIAAYTASFNDANQILAAVGSEAAAACPGVEAPPGVTTLP